MFNIIRWSLSFLLKICSLATIFSFLRIFCTIAYLRYDSLFNFGLLKFFFGIFLKQGIEQERFFFFKELIEKRCSFSFFGEIFWKAACLHCEFLENTKWRMQAFISSFYCRSNWRFHWCRDQWKYPVTIFSLLFDRRRQNGNDIFFLWSIKKETKQLSFSTEIFFAMR